MYTRRGMGIFLFMNLFFIIRFGRAKGVSCSDEEAANAQNELQLCSQASVSSLYENIESLSSIDSITKSLCDVLSTINNECVKNLERCFAAEDVKEMEETHMNSMKDFLIAIVDAKVDRSILDKCDKAIAEEKSLDIKSSIQKTISTEATATAIKNDDTLEITVEYGEKDASEREGRYVTTEQIATEKMKEVTRKEATEFHEEVTANQGYVNISSTDKASDVQTIEAKATTMESNSTVSDAPSKATAVEKMKTHKTASARMSIVYLNKAEMRRGNEKQLMIVFGVLTLFFNQID